MPVAVDKGYSTESRFEDAHRVAVQEGHLILSYTSGGNEFPLAVIAPGNWRTAEVLKKD